MTASSRSGVSVSEASVTIRVADARAAPSKRSPTAVDRAEQDAARVGLGVVHLAARGDDLDDPLGHPVRVAAGALADVAKRGRVEAEPLDGDLELVRAHRARRVEALGRLRQRAGRVDHPVGAELLLDVDREVSLHERSLGTYTRRSRLSMAATWSNDVPGHVPLYDGRRRSVGRRVACEPADASRCPSSGATATGCTSRAARSGSASAPRAPSCPRAPSGSASALAAAGARFVDADAAPDDGAARGPRPGAARSTWRSAWEDWEAAGLTADPGQDRVVPYLFPHPGLLADRPPRVPAAIAARAGRFAYDTMTLIGPGHLGGGARPPSTPR